MNKLATFAAGCFWGVEETFLRSGKVLSTKVGYTGGGAGAGVTYEQVCTGKTGHAEAVQLSYDPARASYEDLLAIFWSCHNPTTPNRQGPDRGTQYRSAIFWHDEEQRAAAERSKTKQGERLSEPIVTEIVAAGPFYPAEEYHQQYLRKTGQSCHLVL